VGGSRGDVNGTVYGLGPKKERGKGSDAAGENGMRWWVSAWYGSSGSVCVDGGFGWVRSVGRSGAGLTAPIPSALDL
jgi:hypothetical protein